VQDSQELVFIAREKVMKTQVAGPNNVAPLSTIMLKVLTCSQVEKIDQMLSEMGDFGELRLIVKKGRVRFIEKLESYDAEENQHRS
jgi:hypothetical protein